MTDEELMAAHARGDRAAFDELFRRYAARLLVVLGRGLRRREDANDLLQQVFLQLHRHRNDYQSERPFRPWLYTIALNLKRQHLRYHGRRPESELDASLESTLSTPGEQLRFEDRQSLDRALAVLSEEAREVVLLHWFGGLSMAEIGELLGASVSAIKVRSHRAYHSMRQCLERSAVAEELLESKPVSAVRETQVTGTRRRSNKL